MSVYHFYQVGISIYVDTSAQEGVKEVLEAFDMAAILTLQERADRYLIIVLCLNMNEF